MKPTRTAILRTFRLSVILLITVLIIIYAVWRSLNYARGPNIEIYSPIDGSLATSTTIDITGRAQRIKQLSLNGKSISIDEQGFFQETILVFPGLNWLELVAHDQFGRETEKQLMVVGNFPTP